MNNVEPSWLGQALKGNAEAFTQLVETYQSPVYNLCCRMLGDGYEAEDAAQETFLRAYTNLHKYDRSRSFSTWLLSIAAHYCIDQIRKRRMTLISLDDNPMVDPPDQTLGPEPALGQTELRRRIQGLLNNLGPQDRAVVIMYYWYDLAYEEIAQSLGLTLSAVKSRLHRARLALSESWVEQEAQTAATIEAARQERRHNGKAESPAF